MAVAFIKGVQGEKVVATPKHFVANSIGCKRLRYTSFKLYLAIVKTNNGRR